MKESTAIFWTGLIDGLLGMFLFSWGAAFHNTWNQVIGIAAIGVGVIGLKMAARRRRLERFIQEWEKRGRCK